MSYLIQEWREELLYGKSDYSVDLLEGENHTILYDDSFEGFDGIVTIFIDDSLGIMGCLEGDWRREFDEEFEEGYEASFRLFRSLYLEFGLEMVVI